MKETVSYSIRKTLTILVVLPLAGCIRYGPWERSEDLDAPWVSASQHVIQECRWQYPGFMMIADPVYRCRQIGTDQKRLDFVKQAHRIEKYILSEEIRGFEIDMSAERFEIRSGGRPLWVPSMDPLAVFVMSGTVPPLSEQFEYIGKVGANVYFQPSTMLRDLEFWFSPDLEVGPSEISFVDGTATILLSTDQLVLSASSKGIVAVRTPNLE